MCCRLFRVISKNKKAELGIANQRIYRLFFKKRSVFLSRVQNRSWWETLFKPQYTTQHNIPVHANYMCIYTYIYMYMYMHMYTYFFLGPFG
jgi:hypothetical protein